MEKTTRTQLIVERKRRHWSQQEVADFIGTTQNNVSRWELGLTTPNPYFRAKLCDLFGKPAEDLGFVKKNSPPFPSEKKVVEPGATCPSSTRPVTIWTIPYARNPHFTGREDILDQLDHLFSFTEQDGAMVTRRAALTQPLAIKGLGGIGKTQIAVEYAYRAREQDRYTHTLWINAANEEAIITSFVTLATLLPTLPITGGADQRQIIAAVKRRLEQCEHRWLLIFDNVEDISLIQPYLPPGGIGHILLTTRATGVGSLASSLAVETMGFVEGISLLLRRSRRAELISEDEVDEAGNLVVALDAFPLALDQAGAYIEETGCSFRDYLQIYHKHRRTLLARRGGQATNYPHSVATTWSLSFQKIKQACPAAAELLRVLTFLAPDRIPEELLRQSMLHWTPLLQQAVDDLLSWNQMLEELLKCSLVKRLTEDHLLSIHRLVQAVQMDAMEQKEQHEWAERVIRAIHDLFPRDPKGMVSTWPQCLRYLDQVQACDTLIQQYQVRIPEATDLLERTGVFLREYAAYPLSELLFQRAQQICEQQGGTEHPGLASIHYNTGLLYYIQGMYTQAQRLFQKALYLQEQAFGEEHLQVALPLIGLAILYREQGAYTEAEPLLQRALHIREQALGSDHSLVATPLYNLASLYHLQGKDEEAASLYQRALCLREHQLGPDHPDVAYPLYGLAELTRKQKRYAQAEAQYKRAIAILTRHLGPDHPKIFLLLHGLAELYRVQQQNVQAQFFYQQALALAEQLGFEHPHTAETLHGFATFQTTAGNLQEATRLYQRALTIREHVHGPQHPKTSETRTALCTIWQTMDKADVAFIERG